MKGYFKYCIFLPGLIFYCQGNFAQSQDEIDSLENKLKISQDDTVKANILNSLSGILRKKGNFENAAQYANNALEISLKKNFLKGESNAYNNLGLINDNQGNYSKALEYYNKSLELNRRMQNKKGIASTLTNIGTVYDDQGNYTKALESYFEALKLFEESENKRGIASSLNNIGIIYHRQENYTKALEYYFQSLHIREDIDDNGGIAIILTNIGEIYRLQGKNSKALENFLKALKIDEESGDKRNIADDYNNIGLIYQNLNDYKKALEYIFQSLKIRENINDRHGIAACYINIGAIYTLQKNFAEALDFLNKGLSLSREIGSKEFIKNVYQGLSELAVAQENYREAYHYQNLFFKIKDSLSNDAKIEELVAKYQKEKDDAIFKQQQEIEKYKFFVIEIICGAALLFLAALAFILYKRYKLKHKLSEQLSLKNEIIENKNKDITDSIQYARRIQKAMLASDFILQKNLPDHFIFYKPKDIVSGDFYWCADSGNKVFVATADCTGHGVPGALMSMIGISLLNKIILEQKILQPDLILNRLRDEIIKSLNPEGSLYEAKDGMDIALCAYDFENKKLEFACANNSLYLVRHNSLTEFKPDKFPVGKYGEAQKPFKLQIAELQAGDLLYTFSDGFADQFGGEKKKKFKYSRFKELLFLNHTREMKNQKENLEMSFENWKNDLEQIDDVLIVGIKIK